MKTVPISHFKATCIATLKRVQKTGVPVVVTLRGQPLVTVGAFKPDPRKGRLGSLATRTRIRGDLVGFTGLKDWEAAR